jgi:hypothetical protein
VATGPDGIHFPQRPLAALFGNTKTRSLELCFSLGVGKHVFIAGVSFPHWSRPSTDLRSDTSSVAKLSCQGFYDLGLQDVNMPYPSSTAHSNDSSGSVRVETCFDFGVTGSNCLLFIGHLMAKSSLVIPLCRYNTKYV